MKDKPTRPEYLPYNRTKQYIIGMDDIRTLLIKKIMITHRSETIYNMWVLHDFPSVSDVAKKEKHSLIVDTYIPKYKTVDDEIKDRISSHELYRDGRISITQ